MIPRTRKSRATRPSSWTRVDPPPAAGGRLAPVVAATAFGLAAGLLELAVRVAQDAITGTVAYEELRTNRYYLGLVPASAVLVLGVPALLLVLAARGRSRRRRRLAAFAAAFAAFVGPLLTIRGLAPWACALLAAGLAARASRLVAEHPGPAQRLARRALPILAAAALALAATAAAREAARRARPAEAVAGRPGAPNVLLIVMDTVRADSTTLHGYDRDTTPNLARLATRGVAFDRARSTASWTLPSHASLFTGRWPHELSTRVDRALDGDAPTLAESLAAHGYDTAGFVANTYYCNAWYGLDRGFRVYEDHEQNDDLSPTELLRGGELGRRLVEALAEAGLPLPGAVSVRKSADRINRDVLEWLDARPGGRPFFAFLNYYDAHGPYQPPEGAERRFSRRGPGEPSPAETLRAFRDVSRRGATRPDAHEVIRRAVALRRDLYDDCITYLDDRIGALLDELGRRGVLDDTLVVVTADHGEHFGRHGVFGHGVSLYRREVHVPLVIAGPGVAGGRRVARPVSLRDIPATVADLAGLADAAPFPGHSLLQPVDRPAPVLCEVEQQTKFPPSPHIPASLGPLAELVDEGRVYIRGAGGSEELYDLAGDPDEVRNLAPVPAEAARLDALRATLDALLSGHD